jgi:hypothetical protein
MFEFKPDYEQAKERIEAWWHCEVIDRAMTYIMFAKPEEERVPVPDSRHATLRERWMDAEFVARRALANLSNTVFYADSMPLAYPNLGPDIMAAFYGCELEFGETTSWSIPILKDWEPSSVARIRLNLNGFYFKKIMEITDALLDVGRGKFIVGYTDLHGAADTVAALRDPQMLNIDVLEHPEEVKKLCRRVTQGLLKVYDIFYDKLTAEGMPSTTWMHIIHEGKMHVPSNDFSCMVSDKVMEELFIADTICECAHMDRNIYHLDGPQALRFLDRIMEIPNLHAIQWVPGANRDYWKNWVHVYQRIQNAGKALVIYVPANDLEDVFRCLKPEGVWLWVQGVKDKQEADAALKKVAGWTRKRS